MEHSKSVTRKWNIVNDEPDANYDIGNKIIYKTEVLKSNLFDYNDAYILAKGNIIISGNMAVRLAF